MCKHSIFSKIKIYITLHYITLHYTTLHYTTLHYTTLHYTTLHYITLHYITLHYITLHYITLHYITLHYIIRKLSHRCFVLVNACSKIKSTLKYNENVTLVLCISIMIVATINVSPSSLPLFST